jgi:hypothetical protein
MSRFSIARQYQRSFVRSREPRIFIGIYLRTVERDGDGSALSGTVLREPVRWWFRAKHWFCSFTWSISATTALRCLQIFYIVNFSAADWPIWVSFSSLIRSIGVSGTIVIWTLSRRWIQWEGRIGHPPKMSPFECGREDAPETSMQPDTQDVDHHLDTKFTPKGRTHRDFHEKWSENSTSNSRVKMYGRRTNKMENGRRTQGKESCLRTNSKNQREPGRRIKINHRREGAFGNAHVFAKT